MQANENTNRNPFDLLESHLLSIKASLDDLRRTIDSTSHNEKEWYSISEASQRLGCSRITLYRNAQSGKVPVKNVGTRLLIPGSYVNTIQSKLK